mgnify:CR=1 FL=1
MNQTFPYTTHAANKLAKAYYRYLRNHGHVPTQAKTLARQHAANDIHAIKRAIRSSQAYAQGLIYTRDDSPSHPRCCPS